MIIYVLEWGRDSYYAKSEQLMNLLAFPTLEDAVSIAMRYEENVPNIIKYDLENRKVLHEWYDIPALDAKIGAL